MLINVHKAFRQRAREYITGLDYIIYSVSNDAKEDFKNTNKLKIEVSKSTIWADPV
jgi:hypothetical protein